MLGIGSNSPAKWSLARTNSGSPERVNRATPNLSERFWHSVRGGVSCPIESGSPGRVDRASPSRSDRTPSYREPERPVVSVRSNPCRPIDSIGRPCFCPIEPGREIQFCHTETSIFGNCWGVLGNFLARYKSQKLGLLFACLTETLQRLLGER